MLCSECKKNNATVFYQQSINGKVTELALCQSCAAKHGINTKVSLFDSFFDIPKIISTKSEPEAVCTLCGSNQSDFIRDGKVSCPKCYQAFANRLNSSIKRIHGNVSHIGRAPAKFKKQNDKKQILLDLKRQLDSAIEKQEFENAAIIRDKIRDIENND